jgi:ABC-2 type transport system permease protein
VKPLQLPVFSRFLADNRRALLGWSIGLIALCLMYLPLYPSLAGGDLEALFAQLPEAFQSAFGLTTLVDGIGYTHSSLLSLSAVLLLLIAVLGWSTRAIAGDEESGALELLLAHPVTRTQLVLQRGAALALQTLWLALVIAAMIIALSGPSQLGIAAGNALAAGLALAGLTLLFGMVAFTAGALSGRRSVALGAGAGLAVLGYLLDAISGQAQWLAPLQRFSPFHWAYAGEPLRYGPDWVGLGLLFGVSALLLLIAVWGLARRDIGTAA